MKNDKMTGTQITPQPTTAAPEDMTAQVTQLNKPLKAMLVKMVLLGISTVVLLAATIMFTVAWYTKMVSVSGLEFKTAQWDFTANYSVDEIAVNVYEYTTLTDEPDPVAAPGTKGYIPLRLSAFQSDTDIEFTLLLDRGNMSEDFQKRIFFYCYVDADGNILNTEEGTKVYLHGGPSDVGGTEPTKPVPMTGTIKHGESTDVYIFWEWLYEAPTGSTTLEAEAWDEFDSKVGNNPKLYKEQMNAKISVLGVQMKPIPKDGQS